MTQDDFAIADDKPAQPAGQGMAIAALICSILGVITCGLTSIVGLILGIIALTKGAGRGLAIAAVVIGGLGLMVIPIAIIAAIAIPNLLESRVTANESAAASTLKASLFPAQVQFQGGGYCDQDGDGVGEYGFLGELGGQCPVGELPAGQLFLISGPLASPPHQANGYRFAIFLPERQDAGLGAPAGGAARAPLRDSADLQERQWIAYAWPEVPGKTGRRVFAITQAGEVHSSNDPLVRTTVPAWNALFAGGGWDAEPAWPPHRR